jgi:hypothetical protein
MRLQPGAPHGGKLGSPQEDGIASLTCGMPIIGNCFSSSSL